MRFSTFFPVILIALAPFLSSCHCDHDLEPKAPFKVGHVLCTDGSVLSLCDYSVSDKTAVGIVFWVNPEPAPEKLGYAVYIEDLGAMAFSESLSVKQGTSCSLLEDDGNTNTYALYSNEDVKSPMADKVFDLWTYGQSAYVPSVEQLRKLFSMRDFVNKRILAVGGTPIEEDFKNCWLWTSTEVEGQEADKAWLYAMNSSQLLETPKTQEHIVRPVVTISR